MIAPALALVFGFQANPPVPISGQGITLFHNCQIAVRLTDADQAGTPDEESAKRECLSYVEGFSTGLGIGKLICSPATPIEVFVRVYVQFMEHNPKYLNDYKMVGLYTALALSFPCTKK